MSTASISSKAATNGIAAIAQQTSTSNKFWNLLDVAECAWNAKQKNASILFLPECFGFMGESSEQTLKNAEPFPEGKQNEASITDMLKSVANGNGREHEDGQQRDGVMLLAGLRTIACETGLWISAGGMHTIAETADGQTKRVYNSHVIIDGKGQIQCKYDKIHLFDVSIPGKVELRESATTSPGKNLVVCDSPIGKLGLSTCYDMRFPEMYTQLVAQGAQILLAPSAFTVPTGIAHWHTLLRARAIENQCYMIAAAQFGQHNHKRQSFGHSLAIDPWGEVLSDAGGYEYGPKQRKALRDGLAAQVEGGMQSTPSIITCNVDLTLVDSVRERMPVQQHRNAAEF